MHHVVECRGTTAVKFAIVSFIVLIWMCVPAGAAEEAGTTASGAPVLEKVAPEFGARWFTKNGYKDFFEPRIAFIKRKIGYSEVIEYSWRPMVPFGMKNDERIDRVQFSFNRYYYNGPKIFYGGGVGGNIILFTDALKDLGKARYNLDLKDGVNGLFRAFAGYKIRDFKFGKYKFPLVARVDAIYSPPYEFGGDLAASGNKIKLTEVTAGLALSVE
ncbi:hypothetical protein KBA41_02795 [Candidatus Ozemobacteraceae bacterium]|nr:hypothetical protein [Candidatus Ozemobacteraceae bacterium]